MYTCIYIFIHSGLLSSLFFFTLPWVNKKENLQKYSKCSASNTVNYKNIYMLRYYQRTKKICEILYKYRNFFKQSAKYCINTGKYQKDD